MFALYTILMAREKKNAAMEEKLTSPLWLKQKIDESLDLR